MWRHDTRAVMVIADGKSKFIGETKLDKSDYVPEPLPEEMRLRLCLLEGAERRQNLLRRWSGRAPVPMTGNMNLVG